MQQQVESQAAQGCVGQGVGVVHGVGENLSRVWAYEEREGSWGLGRQHRDREAMGGRWRGSWGWQVHLLPFPTLRVYGSLGAYGMEELVVVMA